jgi:hypothetical protein
VISTPQTSAFAAMEGAGQERFEAFYYRALIAVQKGDAATSRAAITSGSVPGLTWFPHNSPLPKPSGAKMIWTARSRVFRPSPPIIRRRPIEVFRYQAELLQLAGRHGRGTRGI